MLGAFATLYRKVLRNAKDDSGQTVLIVAGVLTGIALTALALFLNLDAGQRIINRLKSGSSSQVTAQQAVLAYYFQNMTSGVGVLPCPDSKSTPDGVADETNIANPYCDGTSGHPNAGVLPWKTLGLSRDQALDGNGNYLTYVVAPTLSAKKICDTITTNYGGNSEVTGTVSDSTLRVTGSDGSTSDAPFAIIGHGTNGLGALTSANKATTEPTSSAELANCDPAVTACSHATVMGTTTPLVSGPFKGSQGDSAFDDQVYVPTTSSLERMCQTLTPGGALNATLTDNFAPVASANDANSDGLDDRKYSAETHGVTTASDADGRYAKFANGGAGAIGAALITNKDNYNTDPRVRPVYTSLIWTPDITNVGTGGISIATRVTGADQGTTTPSTTNTDVFGLLGAHGVTVRFYSTGTVGGTNKITIVEDDGTTTTTSGDSSTDTYTLLSGESYLVESYDDGSHVWGRITQVNNYANTATVHATTSSDLTGNNQVAIIGGANTNRVANLSIGYGMVAFNTNGTGYVTRSSNLGLTTSFTAEAWIRPRVLPTSSVLGVILGSWDPALDTTNNNPSGRNSFRLYITSGEKIGLELSTSGHNTEAVTTNLNLTLGEWTHVAATFDASTKTVTFYGNGVAIGSGTVSTSTLNGTTPAEFTVGANAATGTPQDYFNGDISDVRIWTGARSATNIAGDYRKRLSYATGTGIVTDTSPAATLLLNWKLDVDGFNGPTHVLTGSGTGTTANAAYSTGTALSSASMVAGGTGYATSTGGAAYAGALANYYRPFAGDTINSSGTTVAGVCQGYVAHTYECDYRAAGTYHPYSTATSATAFPANLNAVHAKVIGGGGGGFDNTNVAAGGGGGYSAAQLAQINSTRLSGIGLDIIVGDNGTGSSSFTAGTGTVPGSPGFGNGAGGGGASSIRLTSSTVHGLAAGGGGGAGFSNNYLLGSAGCITLSSDPGNKCGLGGPGGGAGLTTPQAKDAGSTLCGGRGGSTSPSGTNPANSFYCALGGADPGYVGSTLTNALTYGGSGGGTASGGTSAAGGGGAGYDAGSTAAGVGAGGGGGGVSNSGGTAGGGEAGGYEFFVYDTITIGGMSATTSGDTVNATFTNSTTGLNVTASYQVTSSDATQSTQALRQAAVATGLTTQINALGNNISASRSGSVITVFQQGASSANTIMSSTVTPSPTGTETVVFNGANVGTCSTGSFNGNNTSATCTLLVGTSGTFAAYQNDTVKFTLSNSHSGSSCPNGVQITYTVGASPPATTTAFATALAAAITASGSTCSVSASSGGTTVVTITVSSSSGSSDHASAESMTSPVVTYVGGSQNATATANCYNTNNAYRMIPVGSSTCGTTSGSSSNGLGGGGGGGYADSNAATLIAQTGLSVATATIGGTTFQANDTVTITLTNSAIATASGIAAWGTTGIAETVTVSSDDVSSSSPLSAIASKLAAKINGDSTNQLQTYGISAFSRGAVVTIAQYGSYSVTTTLTSSVSHPGTGNETVTFSPSSGYMASGSAGGSTDFYYSPSSFTSGLNPGRGGAYQSTTGNAVNGSAGAVLLFW